MPLPTKIHFEISERKILLRILDLFFVFLFLYIVGFIFNFSYFIITPYRWEWTIVLAFYLSLFGTIFELYDLAKASKFDIVFKNIILTSSVTVLIYLLTPFYTPVLPQNRLQIVFFYLAIIAALTLWRIAYISLISSPRFYKRILLIGDAYDANAMLKVFEKSDPNFKLIGYINSKKENNGQVIDEDIQEFDTSDLKRIIKEHTISEIVVSDTISKSLSLKLYSQLLQLLEEGFSIKDYTQVYEDVASKVSLAHIDRDFYKYFPFSRSNQNKMYLMFHFLVDVVLSITGLVIGTAFLPVVVIGNMLANRGPLFYTQERVGKNGKVFKIIKLRSMIVNAEKEGAVWAAKTDHRVTPFGKLLRKTRLDEVPQFLNVLKGDMSVIGPRPERPVFVKELSEQMPFYEVRHVIKPGLTGWAQVKRDYGASADDASEKLQYDLFYIKKRSVYLDINILIKTLSTVIFYRGY